MAGSEASAVASAVMLCITKVSMKHACDINKGLLLWLFFFHILFLCEFDSKAVNNRKKPVVIKNIINGSGKGRHCQKSGPLMFP